MASLSNENFFPFYFSFQEILAVKEGLKPVARTMVKKEQFEQVNSTYNIKNIVSSFNKLGISVFIKNKNADDIVINISKSKELAKCAFELEQKNDFRKIGKLLGFPDCCIDFFVENHKYLFEKKIPFPNQTFINTRGKPIFYTNNILNFESRLDTEGEGKLSKNFHFFSKLLSEYLYLVSHVPCSYNCRKTVKLGRGVLKILKKNNPAYANKIVTTIKKPLIFFDDFNWLFFEGRARNKQLEYTGVLPNRSLVSGQMFEKIKEGNKIEVFDDKMCVLRNGEIIHEINKENKYRGIIIDFQ
jgi:hypothetical protein